MRAATVGLFVMLLAGLGATGRLAIVPLAAPTLPDPAPPVASGTDRRGTPVPADSLVAHAVARDVFRIGRRPAAVAYDPQAAPSPDRPPPPRPALSLHGIVWDGGAEPTALLAGLPGVEGPRAVRRGERLGELRVRTIALDHVVVVGPDTVWILRVREPWH